MEFLSGNESIARGAWEAGCHIGTAYPGTPSTETMETFAMLPGVYAESKRSRSRLRWALLRRVHACSLR